MEAEYINITCIECGNTKAVSIDTAEYCELDDTNFVCAICQQDIMNVN